MMQQTCRSCGKGIHWIKTEKGKPMPCDPQVVTVVTDSGKVIKGRIPHWATCPQADQHRKRG